MSYNLFLDDIRTVSMIYPEAKESDFTVVRTYHDFVETIEQKGLPKFISFDNDLGCDDDGHLLPEGYDAAKWLVYQSQLDLSNLEYCVHSANPVAKNQIETLLSNYIKHQKSMNKLL